jgi:hypothetical protein
LDRLARYKSGESLDDLLAEAAAEREQETPGLQVEAEEIAEAAEAEVAEAEAKEVAKSAELEDEATEEVTDSEESLEPAEEEA